MIGNYSAPRGSVIKVTNNIGEFTGRIFRVPSFLAVSQLCQCPWLILLIQKVKGTGAEYDAKDIS